MTRQPRAARAVLERLLPAERFEAVDGDLTELFALRVAEHGERQARRRYWRDVVSVLVTELVSMPARRTAQPARWLPTGHQLRCGIRALVRQPGFALTVCVLLALGIGVATTVFTVVHALVRQPELEQGHDNLVLVWGTNRTAGQARDVISGPTVLDLQRDNRTLAGLAAFHFSDMTLREHDRAGVISALQVTPEFFDVTGIQPALGRVFTASDAAGAAELVVLSHSFWLRHFGGDPAVLGRTFGSTGQQHVVVGVLPAAFRFFGVPDVVSLLRPEHLRAEDRTYYFYWAIGRLAEGVTAAEAERDLDAIMARIAEAYPATRGWDVTTEPLAAVLAEPVAPAARVALAAAMLVLLIACANVASLLLTRNVARRRELAIRLSLGASRQQVFLELLSETAWLAAAGGAAGLGVAAIGVAVLTRLMPPAIAIGGSAASMAMPVFAIDGTSFVYAAALSAAAVALCGLLPAWRACRQPPQSVLASSARGSTSGRTERRWRDGLVSLEAALATILLVVAALLVQTVSRLTAIDPGFRGAGVMAMIIGRVDDLGPEARARYYTEVLRRVAEVPGVTASALNDYVLLTNEDDYEGVEIEGHPRLPAGGWPREEWRRVSAEYFRTLGIPIVRGRAFTADDTAQTPSVVVINEAMARKYWPGRDPLGQRMRLTARPYGWSQIVGIAGDVREVGVDQPAKPMMFVPYHRAPRPMMALFAQTGGGSEAMVRAIQQAVWSVDAARPVFNVRQVDRLVADSLALRRLAETVSSATAMLALLLTAVGIYATLSYGVSQRTREIGVRVAIGARAGDVVLLVLGQATRPAAIGLALGLVGALWAASLVSHQLYGVSEFDPWTYTLSAVFLLAAAMAACALPALRAARVDPISALKSE